MTRGCTLHSSCAPKQCKTLGSLKSSGTGVVRLVGCAELPERVRLALVELKEALSGLCGERLRGVYLYGSYARGDFHPDSDVDVLIVLAGDVRPGDEISRYNPLVSEICLRHDLLISTFPVPAEWLDTRKDPFFETVRREALLV